MHTNLFARLVDYINSNCGIEAGMVFILCPESLQSPQHLPYSLCIPVNCFQLKYVIKDWVLLLLLLRLIYMYTNSCCIQHSLRAFLYSQLSISVLVLRYDEFVAIQLNVVDLHYVISMHKVYYNVFNHLQNNWSLGLPLSDGTCTTDIWFTICSTIKGKSFHILYMN